jgi:hypothetical protein
MKWAVGVIFLLLIPLFISKLHDFMYNGLSKKEVEFCHEDMPRVFNVQMLFRSDCIDK